MIKNTTQNWTIGQVVRVGFVSNLKVTGIEAQEGYPDCYKLEGANGAIYEFVPHYGLNLIKPATAKPSKLEQRRQAINDLNAKLERGGMGENSI